MKLSLFILLLVILSSKAMSQGLYDEEQKYHLLLSGKTRVKEFEDGQLVAVWLVDPSGRTITIHTLGDSRIYTGGPKFDGKYSTVRLKKYSFNDKGNVAEILWVDYRTEYREDNQFREETIADSTRAVYSFPPGETWVANKKHYTVRNGHLTLIRSEYYGYDSQKRIVLLLQNEGVVQFLYSYDDEGRISRQEYLGVEIKYEYNSRGQMTRSVSGAFETTYEYNEDSLPARYISKGKTQEVITFEYE